MTTQVIPLLRMNPAAAVVMDSDRAMKGGRLNCTKVRVRKECEASGCLCWVTDGREIENYLSPALISTFVARRAQSAPGKSTVGRYEKLQTSLERAFRSVGAQCPKYDDRKVTYAREFANAMTEMDMGKDLNVRIDRLVGAIKQANR